MKRVIALLMLFLLQGCYPLLKPAGTSSDEYLRSAAVLTKEKKFAEAAKLYDRVMIETPQSDAAGEARFQIALLHAWLDNPQKDYAQAISGLEDFIKRFPHHVRIPDAENWRGTLKAMQEIKKENDRLKKNMEQLRKLDIQHEERRKAL